MGLLRHCERLRRTLSILMVLTYSVTTVSWAVTPVGADRAQPYEHPQLGTVGLIHVCAPTAKTYALSLERDLRDLTRPLLLRDTLSGEVVGVIRPPTQEEGVPFLDLQLGTHAYRLDAHDWPGSLRVRSHGPVTWEEPPQGGLLVKAPGVGFARDTFVKGHLAVETQRLTPQGRVGALSLHLRVTQGHNVQGLLSLTTLLLEGDWHNEGLLGAWESMSVRGAGFHNQEHGRILCGGPLSVQVRTYRDGGTTHLGGRGQYRAKEAIWDATFGFQGQGLILQTGLWRNHLIPVPSLDERPTLSPEPQAGVVSVGETFAVNAHHLEGPGGGTVVQDPHLRDRQEGGGLLTRFRDVLGSLEDAPASLPPGSPAHSPSPSHPLGSGVFVWSPGDYSTALAVWMDNGPLLLESVRSLDARGPLHNPAPNPTLLKAGKRLSVATAQLGDHTTLEAPHKDIRGDSSTLRSSRLILHGGQTTLGPRGGGDDPAALLDTRVKKLYVEEPGALRLCAFLRGLQTLYVHNQGGIRGWASLEDVDEVALCSDQAIKLVLQGVNRLGELGLESQRSVTLEGVRGEASLAMSRGFYAASPDTLLMHLPLHLDTVEHQGVNFQLGYNTPLHCKDLRIQGTGTVRTASPVTCDALDVHSALVELLEPLEARVHIHTKTYGSERIFMKALRAPQVTVASRSLVNLEAVKAQQGQIASEIGLNLGSVEVDHLKAQGGEEGVTVTHTLKGIDPVLVSEGPLKVKEVRATGKVAMVSNSPVTSLKVEAPRSHVQGKGVFLAKLKSLQSTLQSAQSVWVPDLEGSAQSTCRAQGDSVRLHTHGEGSIKAEATLDVRVSGQAHQVKATGSRVDLHDLKASLATARARDYARVSGEVAQVRLNAPSMEVGEESVIGSVVTEGSGHLTLAMKAPLQQLVNEQRCGLSMPQGGSIEKARFKVRSLITQEPVRLGQCHGSVGMVLNQGPLTFEKPSSLVVADRIANGGGIHYEETLDLALGSMVGLGRTARGDPALVRGPGILKLTLERGGPCLLDDLLGANHGFQVGSVDVTDRSLAAHTLPLRSSVSVPTTLTLAGSLEGRHRTLDGHQDLTLRTAGDMNLPQLKVNLQGILTREVGGDGDFTGSDVRAQALHTQVRGQGTFTKARERAPLIQNRIAGKVEVTAAQFLAQHLSNPTGPAGNVAASLLFLAGELTGHPTVVRTPLPRGYEDHIDMRPTFVCEGRATVLAQKLFYLVAPLLKAGKEELTYGSLQGNALTPAQPLERLEQWVTHSVEESGWGPFSTEEETTTHHRVHTTWEEPAQIESGGPTRALAGKRDGLLHQPGLNLTSEGVFEIRAAKAFFPATTTRTYTTTHRESTESGLFGDAQETSHDEQMHARSQGPSWTLKEGLRFKGQQLFLEAPTLDSRKAWDLGGALLHLALGRNQVRTALYEQASNWLWQEMSMSQGEHLTYVLPVVSSPFAIHRGTGRLEYTPGREQRYAQALRFVHSHPHWEPRYEHHQETSMEVGGLSPAVCALMNLTAVIATQGFWGPGAFAAMGDAALGYMAGQASIALMNHQGHLGKAVDDLARDETLKGLLRETLTAGATHGLAHGMGVNLDPRKSKTFMDHGRRAAVHTAARTLGRATVGERVRGEDVATGFAASAGGGYLASAIGRAYQAGQMDAFVHKLAHGAVGGLSGALLGDPVAGALGAFVAELSAEMLDPDGKTLDDRVHRAQEHKGATLTPEEFEAACMPVFTATANQAKITAALSALLTRHDVDVAAATATTALENNYTNVAVTALYQAYALGQALIRGTQAVLKALETYGISRIVSAGQVIYRLTVGSETQDYRSPEAALTGLKDHNPGLYTAIAAHIPEVTSVLGKMGENAGAPVLEKGKHSTSKGSSSGMRTGGSASVGGAMPPEGGDPENRNGNDSGDEKKLFPNTPDKSEIKGEFKRLGKIARQSKVDGSVWEKDMASHGGPQWKRWPNRRSWERGDKPQSVWPDGRVRK